jgi:hypothetical protein
MATANGRSPLVVVEYAHSSSTDTDRDLGPPHVDCGRDTPHRVSGRRTQHYPSDAASKAKHLATGTARPPGGLAQRSARQSAHGTARRRARVLGTRPAAHAFASPPPASTSTGRHKERPGSPLGPRAATASGAVCLPTSQARGPLERCERDGHSVRVVVTDDGWAMPRAGGGQGASPVASITCLSLGARRGDRRHCRCEDVIGLQRVAVKSAPRLRTG